MSKDRDRILKGFLALGCIDFEFALVEDIVLEAARTSSRTIEDTFMTAMQLYAVKPELFFDLGNRDEAIQFLHHPNFVQIACKR